VRRGWTGVNPVMQLEPGEKPRWRVEHVRILEGGDLAKLLAHTDDAYRPLLEFLAYTGLRIGEALGLRWCDVDFEALVLRVRQQLSRHRRPKHLKTEAGRRDVVLAPSVTWLLRARWLASSYKAGDQLVFCEANDVKDSTVTERTGLLVDDFQGEAGCPPAEADFIATPLIRVGEMEGGYRPNS
jgi:integrase